MTFAARMDRTAHPTIGIDGGHNGAPASIAINDAQVHPKKTRELAQGDTFAVQCAGGAGYGPAGARDADAIAADVADGYVSPEAAERDYGWKR